MNNNFKAWIQESVTVKFIVVGILTLLLLIPAAMIRNLVRERKDTRNEVVQEISSKWGYSQTITGPVLTIPFRQYQQSNNRTTYVVKYAHFLPDQLNIEGELIPEERYRSLYKVVLYRSDLTISGTFATPDFSVWKTDPETIMWDEAFVSVGITDMRGIKQRLVINFNEEALEVNPGITSRDVIKSGVSAVVPGLSQNDTAVHQFSFNLHVNGSEKIRFIPLGKTTTAHLVSTWESPSFDGAFLPDEREIGEDGFEARWKVLHLNRNFPQQWTGNEYPLGEWAFGVDLMFPVDHYQKTERSAKYAIMFIGLTFLTFFFSELLSKKRVHPIQYLLIGFALVIFYTLLLSLSEHLGFTLAYLIAGGAIIMLITAYSSSILKERKMVALVGFVLTLLYTFLFTILQIEAYSLLMGSIGLFLVMAIIMYLSRNVKWQNSGGEG